MSRLATLVITVILGIYIIYGPLAATVSPVPEWIVLASATAAAPAPMLPPFAHAVLPLAMGPDPGGKSGTQATPEIMDAAMDNGIVRTSASAATTRSVEEAEYKAQLRECDCLSGDARNHCIEYVKLRSGRS